MERERDDERKRERKKKNRCKNPIDAPADGSRSTPETRSAGQVSVKFELAAKRSRKEKKKRKKNRHQPHATHTHTHTHTHTLCLFTGSLSVNFTFGGVRFLFSFLKTGSTRLRLVRVGWGYIKTGHNGFGEVERDR